jgi:heptosyltransferase-2
VVLATALVEKLHAFFPEATIDFLVRKGNESLLANNPSIRSVLIWNKKKRKLANLLRLLSDIRRNKYDKVINLQRYFSTGLLTSLSGAHERIGFDKNPLAFGYTKKIRHHFDVKESRHEVIRNNELVAYFTDDVFYKPRLYPSASDEAKVAGYKTGAFVTMSPSSVWFTKKYPDEKWVELIDHYSGREKVFLLGSPDNIDECKKIAGLTANKNVEILAGRLSFLQSAALMRDAVMNFTNDSAPLHFASAVNAPVTAIFCSTVPAFGYGPLSDKSFIVETQFHLKCRPCGLHGHKACPLGHFKCAHTITTGQVLNYLHAN